jgi:hypothetical protein
MVIFDDDYQCQATGGLCDIDTCPFVFWMESAKHLGAKND